MSRLNREQAGELTGAEVADEVRSHVLRAAGEGTRYAEVAAQLPASALLAVYHAAATAQFNATTNSAACYPPNGTYVRRSLRDFGYA